MKVILKLIKHFYWDLPIYKKKSKLKFKNLDDFQATVIKTVEKKGYFLAKEYFKNDEIISMTKAAKSYEKEIKGSHLNLSFPDYGVERYLGVDSVKELLPFYSDYFDQIGINYVGGNGVRYQTMFERKGSLNKISVSDTAHFDDWKKRFKIFLYLNDVTKNNCPFVIYENSVDNYQGRESKEIEYILGKKNGAFGYLSRNEEITLLKNDNVKCMSIEAKAGSVIFVDTRFIHKGTPPLTNDERLLLASYFDIR